MYYSIVLLLLLLLLLLAVPLSCVLQFTALTHLAITLDSTASASSVAELTGLRSL